MSVATENELAKVRQLGSSRAHYARVLGLTWQQGTVFGCNVIFALPPVATLCGSVLRGQTIRLPASTDSGYAVTCRACVAVERAISVAAS